MSATKIDLPRITSPRVKLETALIVAWLAVTTLVVAVLRGVAGLDDFLNFVVADNLRLT